MLIRRAQKKDIERVKELLFQVNNVHAEGRPDLFKKGGIKYTDEELISIFGNDESPVYVYLDDEDYLCGYGFCVYEQVKDSSNMQDMKTCYIDDICIDADKRKQGIGEKIYRHILKCAKEDGCNRVTLNVWACNPGAVKFYEKMGLVPLKTMMEQKL